MPIRRRRVQLGKISSILHISHDGFSSGIWWCYLFIDLFRLRGPRHIRNCPNFSIRSSSFCTFFFKAKGILRVALTMGTASGRNSMWCLHSKDLVEIVGEFLNHFVRHRFVYVSLTCCAMASLLSLHRFFWLNLTFQLNPTLAKVHPNLWITLCNIYFCNVSTHFPYTLFSELLYADRFVCLSFSLGLSINFK